MPPQSTRARSCDPPSDAGHLYGLVAAFAVSSAWTAVAAVLLVHGQRDRLLALSAFGELAVAGARLAFADHEVGPVFVPVSALRQPRAVAADAPLLGHLRGAHDATLRLWSSVRCAGSPAASKASPPM